MKRPDVEQNPLEVRYHYTIGEETSANGLFLKTNEKIENASMSVHIRQLRSQDALWSLKTYLGSTSR